jgi:ABC-type phosphate transport system auxiliary subunit
MSLVIVILVVVVILVILGLGVTAFWDAIVRGWNELVQDAEGARDLKCLEENRDCSSKQQARAFEK